MKEYRIHWTDKWGESREHYLLASSEVYAVLRFRDNHAHFDYFKAENVRAEEVTYDIG